jgi:hypothetical protein
VPLSAGGVWGLGVSAVFLAVCWMTTEIFPFHYLEISAGRPPAQTSYWAATYCSWYSGA